MKKLLLLFSIALVFALAGCKNENLGYSKSPILINNTDKTATSSVIDIKDAKKATLFLTHNAGVYGYATTTFTVIVSEDGTNYTTYNKLIDNVANTNSQTITRVASKAYQGTTTAAILSLDLQNDAFNYLKVVATVATSTGFGSNGATVRSIIEY